MPEQDISGLGWSDSTGGTLPSPPSAPPPVLGTNDLQAAIDKFDQAVDKLAKLYDRAAGGGFGNNGIGSNSTNNGGFGSANRGVFGLGNQYNLGHFGSELAQVLGVQLPGLRGPAGRYYGGMNGLLSRLGGGGGGGFMGTATFGGQPMGGAPVSPPGNGGYSQGGGGGMAPPGGGSGGYNNGGYSSGGSGLGGFGWMATGATSLLSGLAGFGSSSMPTQMAMSQMQQQGTLLAPSSVTNFGVYGDQMRTQAFGSHNANPNNFAMNAQDAAAGYGILQQMAGSGLALSNSYGRFGYGAAASFAGANPSMSYTQAASLAQGMMTPVMSLQMRQLGYGRTPLNIGGGANSFGSVLGSMMQRWYGGQSVAPQNLAASLRPGVGVGWANLESLGYSPDQIQALTSTMEAYNQVGYRGKMSDQQVQQLFQQAQTGNKGAASTLAKYGVTQSDLSQMKKYQAQATMNQSDLYDSFTSGLNGAISGLTRFKQILNDIANLPGINQIIGGGGGAFGTIKNYAGDFKNIGEGAFGLGALAYGGYKLLGGRGVSSLLGKGGILGAAGMMDPELFATVMSGQYLNKILGGNGASGNPLGNLGNVRNTNGNWTAQTMYVNARTVNINGPGPGNAGSGGRGGGPGNPSGGGNTGWDLFRGGNWNPLNLIEQGGYWLGGTFGKMFGKMFGGSSGRTPGSTPTTPGQSNPSMSSGVSGQAKHAVADAETQLGVPYVWGGEVPGQGFDCSGLVQWSYAQAGVSLPRTSQKQWAYLQAKKRSVSMNAVQEGDLVFMPGADGTVDSPGHVGMMINSHQVIEAPQTGQAVKIIPYNPADWDHAGRPAGSLSSSAPTAAASAGSQAAGSPATAGAGGSPNATSEASNVSAALGGSGGGPGVGMGLYAPQTTTSTSSGGTGRAGGTYPNKSGGLIPLNAQAIANYLASKGANRIAIAGILGNIEQESGGNQNAGSNPPGKGFIQILGDPGGTVQEDLVRTWNYIQAHGGIGPVNAAKSATSSATVFCNQYEHPGIPDLQNRIAAANAAYAAGYSAGGVTPGGAVVVGERGPEVAVLPAGTRITDAGSSRKLTGAQQVAQVPWSAPMPVTPAANSSRPVNVCLEFAPGSIVIQQGSGPGANSIQSASNSAREIVSQVAEMLRSEDIYTSIRDGNKWG